jgi:hypothetical protein
MTIIPYSVGCRPGRLCPQLRSWDGDSFYSRTDQDEIDTRNEISQKLVKESIIRFVSPAESGVALKSSNPVASRFRNQRRDLSLQNSRGDWTANELFVAGVRSWDGRLLLCLGR